MGLSRRQKGQAEDPELCCICQRKGPGCWLVCIDDDAHYEELKRKLEEWKREYDHEAVCDGNNCGVTITDSG